ncbi:MAG: hypothetical protein EA369_07465 [Bradymonadales bacterium]|nr:MAG: hypothetical protein EA369_07465 [Bradymonadales bacterium]
MLSIKTLQKSKTQKTYELDVKLSSIGCHIEEELLFKDGMARERVYSRGDEDGVPISHEARDISYWGGAAVVPNHTNLPEASHLSLQYERRGRVSMPKYQIEFEIGPDRYSEVAGVIQEIRHSPLGRSETRGAMKELVSVSVGEGDKLHLISMGILTSLHLKLIRGQRRSLGGQGLLMIQDQRLNSQFLSAI